MVMVRRNWIVAIQRGIAAATLCTLNPKLSCSSLVMASFVPTQYSDTSRRKPFLPPSRIEFSCHRHPHSYPAFWSASPSMNNNQIGINIHQRRLQPQQERRFDNNNDFDETEQNGLIRFVDLVVDIASKPTPGFSSDLPLFYPLSLILSSLLVPSISLLSVGFFFALYVYVGRRSILVFDDDVDDDGKNPENENDDEISPANINLLALGGAIVTAGIFPPLQLDSLDNSNNDDFGLLFATAAAASLLSVVGARLLSDNKTSNNNENTNQEQENSYTPDKDIMDLWDEKFKKSNRDEPTKKN